MKKKEKNIKQFNLDVKTNQGYLYTHTKKLSCKLSNKHISQEIIKTCGDIKNKNIIDIGCGDGTYTFEFLKYNPNNILGVDPAKNAISTAKTRYESQHQKIKFTTTDIYKLNTLNRHFDIAIVRGVLHHLYHAEKAIKQLSLIADIAIIIEPNGYNPILKIIERLSPYHRNHEEKSYLPSVLKKWLRQNQGKIVSEEYCGLVPFFCPDLLVKILKYFEPVIERVPFLNKIFCAVYITKTEFK